MNTKNIITLISYIILIFLLSDVSSKKSMAFSHLHQQDLNKFQHVAGEKCFYGSVAFMTDLMKTNSENYRNGLTVNDNIQKILDFVDLFSAFEASVIDLVVTQELVDGFRAHLNLIMNESKVPEFVSTTEKLEDPLAGFMSLSNKFQIQKVNEIWTSFNYNFDAHLNKDGQKPTYFNEDMKKYTTYSRQYKLWAKIYSDSATDCFPTNTQKSEVCFNELLKDHNCENLNVDEIGKVLELPKNYFSENGGIVFAFWARVSLKKVKEGDITVFKLNKSDNITKLVYTLGSDEQSIDMRLCVGTECITVNNTSDCEDYTYNLVAIQKKVDHYNLTWVVKSWVLNSRSAYTINLPPHFIENSTVEIDNVSGSNIVNESDIRLFKNYCFDIFNTDHLTKENEMVSIMCGSSWAQKLDEAIEVCEIDVPFCDYVNPDASCGVCEEDAKSYRHSCTKECPEGTYENDDKECIDCCPKKDCKTCDKDGCTDCNSPKVLNGKKCTDHCPEDQYPKIVDALKAPVCTPCLDGCAECDGPNSCNSCKDKQYLLNNKECINECPKGYYHIEDLPKRCAICPDECETCTSKDYCDSCKNNYFLHDNKCDDFCPNGTYEDHETKTCEDCENNCATCADSTNCVLCEDEFHLHEGDCVSTCPTGYVSIKNVCVPCQDTSCDTCAPTSDNCTKCKQDTGVALYVYNKKCQPECPEGYRQNDETMKCEKCILEHCSKCPAKGGCIQCEKPYMLKTTPTGTKCVSECGPGFVSNEEADKCIECSKAHNCKKCCQKDTEKCTKCYEDKNIWLYKPKCVEECPENTYKVDKECLDCNDKCKTCSNDSSCETCPEGSLFDDGQCVETCGQGKTDVNNICVPCKKKDCLDCNTDIESCDVCAEGLFRLNGFCVLTCPDGYYTEGDECRECHEYCKKCIDATLCKKCHLKSPAGENLYLDEENCVFECKAGFSPNANLECTSCVIPSCLKCNHDNGHCTKCPIDKPLLFEHKCIDTCRDGYVVDLVNNTCVECDSPCKTCSKTPTNCEICIENYEFMAAEHTKNKKENRCVNECPENGFIEINKKCIPCDDPNCKSCPIAKSECDVCKINPDNQKVLLDYKCVDECDPKMYVHNNKCKPCGDNCSTCVSDEKCTVCDDNYYLKDGVCVYPCGDGYTKDDETKRCVKCEDCLYCDPKQPANCIECVDAEVLHKKKCIDKCPEGYTENHETNKCEACSVNECLKCDGHKNTCEKCRDVLYKNECIDPCPHYTREITGPNGQRSCEQCSKNGAMPWTVTHCLKCPKDVDTCKECDSESLLNIITEKCVDKCPIGTYKAKNENKCLPCNDNCATCTDDESCTSCKDDNVLRKDGWCHASCPCGQVNVNQVCKDCIDNCRKCFAASHTEKCHECKKDYFLQPESQHCKKDCPVGYYPNQETKKCEKCNVKCKTCTSATECTECKQGYVNHQGVCDDSCPAGYIEDHVRKICVKCTTTTNCKKCESVQKLDECVECKDITWVLHGTPSDCKDKCPPNHFLEGKYCIPCKEKCKICEDAETCDKCLSPYVLFENDCDPECKSGYVNIAEKCEKCDDLNCHKCNVEKDCVKCVAPMKLKDLICVENCGDGYYNADGKCHKCKDNCKKCTGPNDCQKCTGKKVLHNNECVDLCPDGTVNLNNEGICKNCDSGCKKCHVENTKTCEECIEPKVLQGTVCQNRCDKSFVEKVTNLGYCVPCQTGCLKCCSKTDNCDICVIDMVVQVDKETCEASCRDGEIDVNGKCKPCDIKDCSVCPNKSGCTSCKSPKILHKPTETVAAVCIDTCPEPFYPKDNKCNKCPAECTACTLYNQCTECKEGHFLFEGKCKVDCTEGQVKINGTCIDCVTDKCAVCPVKPEDCTDCKGDLKLYQNYCHEKCIEGTYEIPDDKCKNCSENCKNCVDDSTCTKCYLPFVLQGSVCQEFCNNGFVKVDGICTKCKDKGCKKCKQDTEECKKCFDTFYLTDEKDCTTDCGDDYFEMEDGDDNDKCSPCFDKCRVCESSNTCKECHAGFVVQAVATGITCLEHCIKGYSTLDYKICEKCLVSHCEECPTKLDQCSKCEPNFYLKNGKCVPDCLDNFYADQEDKTCKPCFLDTCRKCNNGVYCELCNYDLVLSHDKENCDFGCPKSTVLIEIPVRQCHLCEDPNCEVCAQDKTTCKKCQANFLSEDGKCEEECGPTWFENQETNTCDKCELLCLECDNEKDCTKCDKDTFLDDGNCKPECPPGKHADEHKECKNCKVLHCHTCANGLGICDKCMSPKVLQGNECVDECLPGFYHKYEERICKPCGDDCHKCLNKEECLQCTAPNVLLLSGKCGKICLTGQYELEVTISQTLDVSPLDKDHPLVKCENCSLTGCMTCPNDKCIECVHDPKQWLKLLAVEVVECTTDCGDYHYHSQNHCDKCMVEHCQSCPSENQCTKCSNNEIGSKEGYVLINNNNNNKDECAEKCPDGFVAVNAICVPCNRNCKKCVGNTTKDCVECNEEFSLFKHKCHEPCPPSTFETLENSLSICKQCPNECDSCESSDKCTACKEGFVLQEGKCISTCTSGWVEVPVDRCEECVDADCDTCNPANLEECTVCKNGKVLLHGDCVEKCGDGYFVQDGKCYPCADKCKVCTTENDCQVCVKGNYFVGDSEVCDLCESPKVTIENRCYECEPTNCYLCITGDKEKCDVCEEPFVLDNFVCKQTCPNGKYNNNGVCEPCEGGCSACQSSTNCTKCETPLLLHKGDCIEICPNHYVKHPTDERCIPCHDAEKCIVCNASNTSECIVCESNSVLHDGVCKEKCPKGHYLVGQECKDCSTNCESCVDNNSCTICNDGWFLKDGRCVDDCKDGYRVENNEKCVKCTANCKVCDADKCTECMNGKVLLDGICEDVCSAETYNKNGKCEPCSKGCLLCESLEQCDKCQDNMAIDENGICVTNCGQGKTFLNGHCVKCKHPDCKLCEKENPENCDKCKSLYTHTDTCIEECPEGMVEDVVNKVCIECNSTCKECKSNTEVDTCTECHVPMILHEGKCINECPPGTRLVKDKCEECADENCNMCGISTYTSEETCWECDKGYPLYKGECLNECPEGTYEFVSVGGDSKCQKCHKGCSLCSSEKECEKCKSGYYLDLKTKTCVQHCPEGDFGDCYENECKPCDPACQNCVWGGSNKCTICQEGFFLKENETCCPPEECPKGTYANTEQKVCSKCKVHYCNECSSEFTCDKCHKNYILRKDICSYNHEITKPVLNGDNLLLSPISSQYGQKGSFSLVEDLNGYGAHSDSISFSFFIKSVGTTQSIKDSNKHSHIFNYKVNANVGLKFDITRIDSQSNCGVEIYDGKDIYPLKFSEFDCSDSSLFDYKYIYLNVTSNKTKKMMTVSYTYLNNTGTYTKKVLPVLHIPDLDDTGTLDSSIHFLDKNEYSGYLISKFNIGDFEFSDNLIADSSYDTPKPVSWLCNDGKVCNDDGLIPLVKGFVKFDETNKIYNLRDSFDIPNVVQSETSFGLKFYIFIDEIHSTKPTVLGTISYEYNESNSLGRVVALQLVANRASTAKLTLEQNTLYLPSSLKIEAKTWYIVSFGVHSDAKSIVYSASVKDEDAVKLFSDFVDASNIKTEEIIKLIIDASISFGTGSGQVYDPQVLITDKINKYKAIAIDDITENALCEKYGRDFSCQQCIEYYIIKDGKCESNFMEHGQQLLFHYPEFENSDNNADRPAYHVYNNNEKEIELPEKYKNAKQWTVIIYLRKLVHSIYSENISAHRLISLKGDEELLPIVSEQIQPVYKSVFQIGKDVHINVDLGDVVFDYHKVFISRNGDNIDLYYFDGVLHTTSFTYKNPSTIVFGDRFGLEIHHEFKNIFIYPQATEETHITKLSQIDIKDADPTCMHSNYLTGFCNKCKGIKSSPEQAGCNISLLGFKFNYTFGFTSIDSIIGKSNYINNIDHNLPDVNSLSYGIFGYVRGLVIPQIDSHNSAKLNLFKIVNDSHVKFYPTNPSNSLIELNMNINEGVAQYRIIVNTSVGTQKLIVEGITPVPGQWIYVALAIDVLEKKLRYYVANKDDTDNVFEGSLELNGFPEKLQNISQLISYAVNSHPSEHYSVLNGETQNLHWVANLGSKYDRIIGYIRDRLVPNTALPQENCEVALNNNIEDFCVECNEGFTFVNDICTPTGLDIADDSAIISPKIFTSGYILSGEQTFPADDQFIHESMTVNLSFYFRFNSSKKNQYVELLKIGSVTVGAAFTDFHPYIKISLPEKDIMLGPLEVDKIYNWMSFTLSYGMFEIYANIRYTGVSLSTIAHQFKHTQTKMSDIAEEYTILDGHRLVDIYGLHLCNKNYGRPLIPEPFRFDCGIDCEVSNCKYQKCYEGKFGIDEDTLTTSFRQINIAKKVNSFIKLNSLPDALTSLRSRNYSFWFIYNTDAEKMVFGVPVSGKSWNNVMTISLGDIPDSEETNEIRLDQSLIKGNKFRVVYDTQYSNTHLTESPTEIFELPNIATNSQIMIFFTIHDGEISVLLYENPLNYEIAIIKVQGQLDFLTSASHIKFGEQIGTEMYQDFSQISCVLDYTLYMENALSMASQISFRTRKQMACEVFNATQGCTKCREGYQVVTDKDGNKSCAFSGAVQADQTGEIRYATNDHPIIYDYDLSANGVDSINFMINIQIPQSSSTNPLGLIRISDIDADGARTTIISLFQKEDSLFSVDRIDTRTINAVDVLKGEDKSNYLTISLRYDNKIGYFKLQTYSASTGQLHSAEVFGTSKGHDINKVQVQLGFEDKHASSQKDFRFKASSAYLYVNTDDNQTAAIKNVTYIRDSCNIPCRTACTDGVCSDKFLEPTIIAQTNAPVTLGSMDTKFVSEEEFHEYYVRVNFERSRLPSESMVFLLSNSATLKTEKLSVEELRISGIPASKSSISINNDLTANFFGTNGLISLLPSGYKADKFNNIDIQIRFNSRTSSINVSICADDLAFEVQTFALGSSNWDIQAINRETLIFNQYGVVVNLSFVNTFEFGTHKIVDVNEYHGYENCLQTRVGLMVGCNKCIEGFYIGPTLGLCIPNSSTNPDNFR